MDIFLFILFWLSIIGYMLFLKYKFNITDEILLGFVFIGISLLIFVFGILNLLTIGSYLILLGGIILFLKTFKERKKDIITSLRKPNFNMIIIFFMVVYVTIAFYNSHLIHYDNFSHWATIVKSILLNDSFPNFEATTIYFKAYQPGTACFIYYFCRWFKFSEGMMIIAQNYLFIALISSVLSFVKGRYRVIFRILFVFTFVFAFTFNILPFDLLVDSILSVILIFIFSLFILYKDNDKMLFTSLLPCVLYLCLVKNCGFALAFLVCCCNLLFYILKGNFKLGLTNSLKLGISCIVLLLIWSAHVKYGFGTIGLSSHHALTFDNILTHLETLGTDTILKFLKIYLDRFLDLKNNFGNVVMLIVNLILVLIILLKKEKKDKKFYKVVLMFIDLLYFAYYIILCLMYIFSMGTEELLRIACFDRYILTMVLALSVLFIMCFIYNEYRNSKRVFVYSFTSLFIVLLSCSLLFYRDRDFGLKNSYSVLLGKNNYKETNSYILDKYLKDKYINLNNENPYYIYYPSYGADLGYLHFLSRYKTNHGNISIVTSTNDIKDYNNDSIIISLENNEQLKKFAKKHNFCEESENIYVRCND